jgi:hypothetical protein
LYGRALPEALDATNGPDRREGVIAHDPATVGLPCGPEIERHWEAFWLGEIPAISGSPSAADLWVLNWRCWAFLHKTLISPQSSDMHHTDRGRDRRSQARAITGMEDDFGQETRVQRSPRRALAHPPQGISREFPVRRKKFPVKAQQIPG